MTEIKPHMVEQVIKYSDGKETVIKYRGVIENGVLIPDVAEDTDTDNEQTKSPKQRKTVLKNK